MDALCLNQVGESINDYDAVELVGEIYNTRRFSPLRGLPSSSCGGLVAYGHLGGPFRPCEWLVSQYVQLQLKNVATRGPKDDLVSQSDFVGRNGTEGRTTSFKEFR